MDRWHGRRQSGLNARELEMDPVSTSCSAPGAFEEKAGLQYESLRILDTENEQWVPTARLGVADCLPRWHGWDRSVFQSTADKHKGVL